MRKTLLGIVVFVLVPGFLPASEPAPLAGVCYGPFRDGQSPLTGGIPSGKAMDEDIRFAANLTRAIRTYSVADTAAEIPAFCERQHLDCYPGAWLGRDRQANRAELEKLIQIARKTLPHVKAVIVGNEPMQRGDFSLDEYVRYVRMVKKAVTVPVAAADTWVTWVRYKNKEGKTQIEDLASAVDVVMVQIYPYWDKVPIERAARYTLDTYDEVQRRHPNKRVVLSEFGWPSAGEVRDGAVPSPGNQARYFQELLPELERRRILYFYFELFDERWKAAQEQQVGANWGLFYSWGGLKPGLKPLLPLAAGQGIVRPPFRAAQRQ
jgi:exo-beta-1,3-glucanase (GH17 family)